MIELPEGTWVTFDVEPIPGVRTRSYGVISGVHGPQGCVQRYVIDLLTFLGDGHEYGSGFYLIPGGAKADMDKVTVTTEAVATGNTATGTGE